MDYNRLAAGIDLHIHSTASDGTLSPSEILALSVAHHLAAIAITDHDTLEGAREVLRIGVPPALKYLSGIEISATPPPAFICPGSFHILGYAIDLDDPDLNHTIDTLQQARKSRNPRIIRSLNDMGIDISLDELHREFGDAQLGRPHIARLMIHKKIVDTIDDAFDKYLGKGRPAYVDKFRLSSADAITMILKAGGIPVLAHPALLETASADALETLLSTLKEMGLKGIEAYYPSHTNRQVTQYLKLAERFHFLVTGGTDFHGKLNPEIQIGTGRGDFFVSYDVYENLVRSV